MDDKKAYYDIKETPIWYIDKIPAFCVNLERRPDRWQQFVTQPGIQALPNVKQFMAVDGSTLDYMNDDRIPLYTKKNIIWIKRLYFLSQVLKLLVHQSRPCCLTVFPVIYSY